MSQDHQPIERKVEDDYEILEKLGSGLHATAYKAACRKTGKLFAIKMMNKILSTRLGREAYQSLLKEARILSILDHDKIVKFAGSYTHNKKISLVLELLEGGELFSYISELKYLSESDAVFFSRQVAEGLEYLHNKKIAHLDLKPENIILKDIETKEIKLVDFSISQEIAPHSSVRTMQGTLEFIAPELLNFENVSCASDMWSFGVLVYFFLVGVSPFFSESENVTQTNIIKVKLNFDHPQFEKIDNKAINLIKNLLVRNPTLRLSASECLKDPWFEKKSRDSSLGSRRNSQIHTDGFKDFVRRNRWDVIKKLTPVADVLNTFRTVATNKDMKHCNSADNIDQLKDDEANDVHLENLTIASMILTPDISPALNDSDESRPNTIDTFSTNERNLAQKQEVNNS